MALQRRSPIVACANFETVFRAAQASNGRLLQRSLVPENAVSWYGVSLHAIQRMGNRSVSAGGRDSVRVNDKGSPYDFSCRIRTMGGSWWYELNFLIFIYLP